jgi:RNA polymerase sigma-70 factor (sigma-E family)
VEHAVVTAGRDEAASRADETAHAAGTTAPRSFEDCYRDAHERMVRAAFLLTGSVETAQDVVQDAFVHLHGKWVTVREPEGYLWRSVVNGCRSQQRRAARDRERQARLRSIETRTPGGDPAAGELDDAIAALPYRQRAAIVLRFYDDLTEAQVAEGLGCRVGTVSSLVHRGIEQLRRTIER